jgi:hypothetical protein
VPGRCWPCVRRGGALPLTKTEMGYIYSNLLGPSSRNSPNRCRLMFNHKHHREGLQNKATALVVRKSVEPYKRRGISVEVSDLSTF